MTIYLGIDAGTTAIKAAFFDPDGRQLAIARKEYTLETPMSNRVELDPEVYWRACCETVRAALAGGGIKAADVAALCISSQGETFIPLDRAGRPAYKAIVWLDNRAGEQAEEIAARFSLAEIYLRTGQPEVAPTWPACKIRWLRENEPEVFARTAHYLMLEDYLLYRLTGQLTTGYSLQTTSLFVDLASGGWWPEMFETVGITPGHWGTLTKPGTAIGSLSAAAAEALGLTTRTLAVTGGMDQAVGALGSGNVTAGMATESTGGALGIVSTVAQPVYDPAGRLPCYFHARPDHYALLPWGQTAGMALRWFRDQFFALEARAAHDAGLDAYDLMTAEAELVPAGSEGLVVLPHLEGAACPELNRNAKAVFFGATLRHARAHFTRGIMEAVAYMLRRNIEMVEAVGGTMREIRATGGGARSSLWLQIKADVLQKPITRVNVEEAGCLGAAMLGAVAVGGHPSLEAAAAAMVSVREVLRPNPAEAGVYQTGYQQYIELYDRLEPMFRSA